MLRHIAYIDPGTGSFALQAAAGAVLGFTYMVRNQFRLIIMKFKRTAKPEETTKN